MRSNINCTRRHTHASWTLKHAHTLTHSFGVVEVSSHYLAGTPISITNTTAVFFCQRADDAVTSNFLTTTKQYRTVKQRADELSVQCKLLSLCYIFLLSFLWVALHVLEKILVTAHLVTQILFAQNIQDSMMTTATHINICKEKKY